MSTQSSQKVLAMAREPIRSDTPDYSEGKANGERDFRISQIAYDLAEVTKRQAIIIQVLADKPWREQANKVNNQWWLIGAIASIMIAFGGFYWVNHETLSKAIAENSNQIARLTVMVERDVKNTQARTGP